MTQEELKIQKGLVSVFIELESELKLTNSTTNRLGWQQRNELVSHVYSNYNNHEKLNDKRNEWKKSLVKGNVLRRIHELFREHQDLYGYFEKPEFIIETIEEYLQVATRKELYEIASELNNWKNKITNKLYQLMLICSSILSRVLFTYWSKIINHE